MATVSNEFSWGFFLGLVLTAGVIALLIYAFRRRLGKQEYDERQKLAQGMAYKCSFYTLLAYLMAGGIFDLGTGIRWCDLFTFTFLGVLASVLVFAVICIAKDAYMPIQQSAVRSIWITFIIGLINLVMGGIDLFTPGVIIVDGVLTHRCVNLLCGILLTGISIAVFIKYRGDQRAASAER